MVLMSLVDIYQMMAQKGLISDPAFADLNFSIEPIPRFNSCPLGLYFPEPEYVPQFGRVIPERTIILPPEAQEGTVLHELGHRYGQYYFNDLSEDFAENFRRRYQGGRACLYIGNDFERIPAFGKLFHEGERGAIEFGLFEPLSIADRAIIEAQLNSFQCECIECGYPMVSQEHCELLRCPRCGGQMRRAERPGPGKPKILYGSTQMPWLRIEFRQSVDWLVIIGSLIAATVVAGTGAIGYAIYKVSKEQSWVVPVAVAGTAAFFLLRAMYRQAKAKIA